MIRSDSSLSASRLVTSTASSRAVGQQRLHDVCAAAGEPFAVVEDEQHTLIRHRPSQRAAGAETGSPRARAIVRIRASGSVTAPMVPSRRRPERA